MSRRGAWLGLLLLAGLAAGVRFGIARFGVPEIKFGHRPAPGRDTSVRDAVADKTDSGEQASPARRGDRPANASPSRTSAPAEDQDASILFDLPALEPEDAEPDPAPTPSRTARATNRDDAGASGAVASICGEVRSAKGVPIEGARVYLTSPARMVRTDRLGRFCVSCPPGQRTVRIESPGRAPLTRTLKLGRERLETRFTLDPAN